MRLFLAEKPSLGRAIAEALTDKPEKKDNYILCGGDVVSWAMGHILRLKEPGEYVPEHKNWSNITYPIIPHPFEYVPTGSALSLFRTIRYLLQKADIVVNAGDCDREGQLLIDEILEYCGYSGVTKRILITDLTQDGIRKALQKMTDNLDYQSVSRAGKARLLSDWLLGINMTMQYTVAAQKNGYRGTPISVGRVQSPVLGIIVSRDRKIDSFSSKPYFVIKMPFNTASGDVIAANWRPGNEQSGIDEEGRLISAEVKNCLIDKLKTAAATGEKGVLARLGKNTRNKRPPLPHSLPTLQIEASESYGISLSDTVKIAQELYEAGILSYPRSDCRYLTESSYMEASRILSGIAAVLPDFQDAVSSADPSRKSLAFDDKKVAEHYAIIPTGKTGRLSGLQKDVFRMAARRFIIQFYPDFEYLQTDGEIAFAGEVFSFSGKETVAAGWKRVPGDGGEKPSADEIPGDCQAKLPSVADGDSFMASEPIAQEKQTLPPKRFTEASIIKAMNNIHFYVDDEDIKKSLKDNDGIGTAATQADIIRKLFDRLYIEKKGKDLYSTGKGRRLIDMLPEVLKTPGLTAMWEKEMRGIAVSETEFGGFMKGVEEKVRELTLDTAARRSEISFIPEQPLPGIELLSATGCFKCGSQMRLLSGKNGKFWLCSNAACKLTCDDSGGKPKKPPLCPRCRAKIIRRASKNGHFWPCGSCGLILNDVNGRPQKAKKCPKCEKGVLKLASSRDGKTQYWSCPDCGNREFEKTASK